MLFILLRSISGRYLHLSIVVQYKTVCNNYIINIECKLYIYLKLLNGCCLIGTIKPSLNLPLPKTPKHPWDTLFYIYINTYIINAFLIRYVMWKGRRANSAKGRYKLRLIVSKSHCYALYHLRHCSCCIAGVFCSVVLPNHTFVGRVSVNILCQQV